MSILHLTEDDFADAAGWRALLGDAFPDLVARGVLEPRQNGRSEQFVLRFVGFIGLRDKLAVCSPRFGLGEIDLVGWLRRVLATYFQREGRRTAGDPLTDLHFREEHLFREIDAVAILLRIYEDAGIYTKRERSIRRQVAGTADWARTIACTDPIIIEGVGFYPEPLCVRRREVENEVSLLQVAVTVSLAMKYEMDVPAPLREAYEASRLSEFLAPANLALHLSAIRRERITTFLAGDLLLLETLESVLEGFQGMSGPDGPMLHGTRAFSMVWEDALRDLFGDDASDADMGQPTWFYLDGTTWSASQTNSGQIIDILVRRPHELLIIDAKYHYPFPKSRPGWADIVKQLFYAETMVRPNGEVVRNAFLLPQSGPNLRLVARVEICGGAREFPPIESWHVDPAWAFSSYGDADICRRVRARDKLFAAREEMAEVLGYTDGEVSR